MLRIEIQDLMEPFWKKQKIFSSLFILLPLGGTIGKTSCVDFAYLLLPGLQNCDMGQWRLAKCVCVFQVSLWEKSSWDYYYYYFCIQVKIVPISLDSLPASNEIMFAKYSAQCLISSKLVPSTWQPLLLKIKLKTHLWLELMAGELPATTKLKGGISVISHVQDICLNSLGYRQLVGSVSSWRQSALPWLLCLQYTERGCVDRNCHS